jgi:hypothetical protein
LRVFFALALIGTRQGGCVTYGNSCTPWGGSAHGVFCRYEGFLAGRSKGIYKIETNREFFDDIVLDLTD